MSRMAECLAGLHRRCMARHAGPDADHPSSHGGAQNDFIDSPAPPGNDRFKKSAKKKNDCSVLSDG